jgi:HPt (histidine-containing phosphotransfer) domain-containing protein
MTDKKLSEVLSQLKAEYLQKLPQKVERLRLLTEAKNWLVLEEEYHNLKGSGKTYGFPEISAVCEKLEFLAHHKETQILVIFNEAVELLDRIEKSYTQGPAFDLFQDATFKTLLRMKAQSEGKS